MELKRGNKKELKKFIYEIKGNKEKEWHYLCRSRVEYTDKVTTTKEMTFEECYQTINNKSEDIFEMGSIYTNTTFFKKQHRICFIDLFDTAKTQKQMGDIIILRAREINQKYSSLFSLSQDMDNESFIAYLKEKGVTYQIIK